MPAILLIISVSPMYPYKGPLCWESKTVECSLSKAWKCSEKKKSFARFVCCQKFYLFLTFAFSVHSTSFPLILVQSNVLRMPVSTNAQGTEKWFILTRCTDTFIRQVRTFQDLIRSNRHALPNWIISSYPSLLLLLCCCCCCLVVVCGGYGDGGVVACLGFCWWRCGGFSDCRVFAVVPNFFDAAAAIVVICKFVLLLLQV